jgi:hypothetical protein
MIGLSTLAHGRRRAPGLLAAVAVAATVAGCGASTASNTTGPRWLVKVRGNYANVYAYPSGNKPASTTAAVRLGLTYTRKELAAAAEKLDVPLSHVETALGT